MGSKCSIMMKSPTGGFCVFRTSQDANPVSLRFNDTLTLTPGGQLEISDMGAHIVRKVLDYTLNENRYLIGGICIYTWSAGGFGKLTSGTCPTINSTTQSMKTRSFRLT